jgi:hypothetical protein
MTVKTTLGLFSFILAAALFCNPARADDEFDLGVGFADGPHFTFRADLWGIPGSIPTQFLGFGVVGMVDTFKGGASGFIAPTPIGVYLGGEGLFGGLKTVGPRLRVGGEGTAGIFTLQSPFLGGSGIVGGAFGGFFDLVFTPEITRDLHIGFRAGVRVFASMFGPSVGPTFAFNLYLGDLSGQ